MPLSGDDQCEDIIDEAIALFRINSLFKNFEVKGRADIILIYLQGFISECLSKLPAKTATEKECLAAFIGTAANDFDLPGDEKFALKLLFRKPAGEQEAEAIKSYLFLLRQECAKRLAKAVVADGKERQLSKWWQCFQKRRFMQNKFY